jgi:hypothetical protein
MDVRMVFDNEKSGHESSRDHHCESPGDSLRFFAEDEKSEIELLADLIHEDFVRCR